MPPLYERIKRALRTEIADGRYVAGQPFVTQREVCARFGVSTITAVRALNDLVAEGILVRRRGRGTFVAEAAPETQPAATRPTGGGISAGETTIAFVVPGLQSTHTARVLSGIESVCAEVGYRLFFSDSGESPEIEEQALVQAIASNVSGVVIYPVQGQSRRDAFDELRGRGIPVVMVDRYRTDVPTDAVTVDDFALGYQVTGCLVDKGHRRIATLWSDTECTSVRDRITGHIQALRDHDLPVLTELTQLRPYLSMTPEARSRTLAGLLDVPDPPTAFLCANGYVLATAAHDLISLGVSIPDNVDIAGMDDAGPYDLLPLAAVAGVLPSRELGRRAMRQLEIRIGSPDRYRDTQHIVLPVQIRTRESAPGHLRAVSARERGR